MVMVQAPDRAAAAGAADTPPTIVPDSEPESDAKNSSDGATDRPTRTFKFREDFADPVDSPPTKSLQDPVTAAPPKSGERTAAAPAPRTQPELAAAQKDGERRSSANVRQWLLIGGAAIVGIALALLVVGILAGRRASPSDDRPAVATSSSKKSAGETRETGKQIDQPADRSTTNSSDDSARDDLPHPTGPAKTDSPVPSTKAADDTRDQADSKTAEPGSAHAASAEQTNDSPPGMVPANGPLGTDAIDAKTPVSKAVSGMDRATVPSPTPGDSTGSSAPTTGPPAMPKVDVSARLSVVIVAVAWERVTVQELTEFVADFCNVPVTLDWDAMLAAGITARTKIDVQLNGVTVGQLLTAALDPLSLTFFVDNGQIRITSKRAIDHELREETYDVSDLQEGDEQLATFAQQLTSLIASPSWNKAGGPGTLTLAETSFKIQQTDEVHYQVIRFLDRLRAARGLIPRSDLPLDQINIAPIFTRKAAALATPLNLNFSEPTTLKRILEFLRTQTDFYVAVDWNSASAVGWWPDTKMTATSDDKPLGEFLDRWLRPQELDYRLIAPDTLQIQSTVSIQKILQVEIYPIKKVPDNKVKELIGQAKSHIGGRFFVSTGGHGVIVYDQPSHSLLVSLPQPQHRALAAWLAARVGTDKKTAPDDS